MAMPQKRHILICSMLMLSILCTYAKGETNRRHAPRSTHQPVQEWLKHINLQKGEIITQIHFFVQDQTSGPNQTVFDVAQASITATSPAKFGRTQVVDHLVTSRPEFNSSRVGRVQGIHVLDDLHEIALTVNWNVLFTDGKYKGSTITLLGRLVAFAKEGELSVVGGTGDFRLARGVAVKRTISRDPKTSNMVMEYHLFVLTPGA